MSVVCRLVLFAVVWCCLVLFGVVWCPLPAVVGGLFDVVSCCSLCYLCSLVCCCLALCVVVWCLLRAVVGVICLIMFVVDVIIVL